MAAGFRIAVFASGQGSNFQNLLDASRAGTLGADIVLLVCDKPQAPVVERARKAGVDCFLFQPKDYARREDYEAEVAAELDKRQIDLVVLAGYMRLLTPVLVEPYAGKMINIHPSLLPAFPGKNAIGQAWDYGVKVTGITVHLVDGGMDTGAVIAQEPVEILASDTLESLEARIHAAEQQLYPQVVSWFAKSRIKVNGRKVTVLSDEEQ
ncbi:phosphoribosylglycinamide formyltransferase [Paenibacillus macerans]|uniref:Phosphoribosylglycinamide formyltransferase n=1 Tax=Paenibacillus macerans TaxID=44252 RepID=A0A090Z5W5_PAEMA|nr:phosphoribosylglycinamide formyltransferase [Paenibacillus macerans]KFN05758.1 phosphoribosylglycinamide formyltransferase [Paenibacillus macerans]MBS5910235.1 phosphoribosylglycinamide formyltransferase [Paenibacillus macerans]MCY7559839.1 phosphoribosylglycinamide formyltransferase [Paenibacillus macerans]MDU5945579.1 phosphoribosylglycinamide formyltransferase [Paenibacillus macerans]MEC0138974.1 phosphoribosylglycinamide formyltransferase [Paenibacillus macerans]